MKKTAFMRWIDEQLEADRRLARAAEDLVGEMKLEQQIVALREKRGLTQAQLAKLLGASQPYVAKLESGRVKNLGVKTLVKCARALGASVSIRMEAINGPSRRSGSRLRGGRVGGPTMNPKKRPVAKYEGMKPEELRESTKVFDEEMVIDESLPLTAAERKAWQTARRKPSRPRKGAGVKAISVSV